MGKTELYIKQCEKAEKIQSLVKNKGTRDVKWNEGDMIALSVEWGKYKVFMYNSCSHSKGIIEPEIYSSFCIWLPRQDELQAMVLKDSLLNLLVDFVRFLQLRRAPSYAAGFKSLEQLWLAFVMKEKYGEEWDTTTEEWVAYGNKT